MALPEPTNPVYLDYNATTPLDEFVIEEIHRSLKEDWGNPSSSHVYGFQAKAVIEQSRTSVARMINANYEDIIFTSGGTESNNIALSSVIEYHKERFGDAKPHVITSNVEHDSIAKVLDRHEKLGNIELSITKVNEAGELEVSSVLSLVKESTCLISIMHANNETGVIFPIQEIGQKLEELNNVRKQLRQSPIYFHCDAAQTIGKVRVDVQALMVHFLTIVGHKFYAPRIGALYVRNLIERSTTPFQHWLQGGGQERGFRPGTENTPMIAGLAKAAELVHINLENYTNAMKQCSDILALKLLDSIPGIKINFIEVKSRLPNTLSVRLPEGVSANFVLNEKCKGKLLASLGAACHSNVDKPSAILLASGLSPEEASRSIRISVGRTTTFAEISSSVNMLKAACSNST